MKRILLTITTLYCTQSGAAALNHRLISKRGINTRVTSNQQLLVINESLTHIEYRIASIVSVDKSSTEVSISKTTPLDQMDRFVGSAVIQNNDKPTHIKQKIRKALRENIDERLFLLKNHLRESKVEVVDQADAEAALAYQNPDYKNIFERLAVRFVNTGSNSIVNIITSHTLNKLKKVKCTALFRN